MAKSKSTKGAKSVKIARSAKTGKFISKKQAARNPATTITQTIKRGGKKK
jgi:hypothetical protein